MKPKQLTTEQYARLLQQHDDELTDARIKCRALQKKRKNFSHHLSVALTRAREALGLSVAEVAMCSLINANIIYKLEKSTMLWTARYFTNYSNALKELASEQLKVIARQTLTEALVD